MEQLADQLEQLERAELVRPVEDEDLAYLFKHALTQESAYESLLLKDRQVIHRRVADAVEALYPEQIDEHAALLAGHYHAAGDDAKTLYYAVRAGDVAARLFAYPEAGEHYARALDALDALADTPEHRRLRVDTLVKQVSVSLRTVGPAKSLERLAAAEALARPRAERARATREDRLRLARVEYWQGHAYSHQNDLQAALAKMRRVAAVARAENDLALLAIPASLVGRALLLQGHFTQAETLLGDAMGALEQLHDEPEWLLAAGFRALALTMLGEYAHGRAEAEQMLARAFQANTPTGKALAHGILGCVDFFGGAPERGIPHARRMIEEAAGSGDRLYAYLAYGFIAWAEARAGGCRAAAQAFAEMEHIAGELGGRLLFADWFAAARAEYALGCESAAQALDVATGVLEEARQTGNLFAASIAARVAGQALARLDPARRDEADAQFRASLAQLEAGGAALEAARTRAAWAQARGEPNSQ